MIKCTEDRPKAGLWRNATTTPFSFGANRRARAECETFLQWSTEERLISTSGSARPLPGWLEITAMTTEFRSGSQLAARIPIVKALM
jgi:hypothetical protein